MNPEKINRIMTNTLALSLEQLNLSVIEMNDVLMWHLTDRDFKQSDLPAWTKLKEVQPKAAHCDSDIIANAYSIAIATLQQLNIDEDVE